MPKYKARVLWLIKGLGLGGAEKLLAMSAPYLDRDRFDYEVGYFLPWKDALVGDLESHGVKVSCFGTKSAVDMRGYLRAWRYIRRNRFDVVHAHLPVASIFGRVAGRLSHVPGIVYTEHGMWQRLHPITRCVNRLSLRMNDLNIAVSSDVAKSMSACGRRTHVETIVNGIDCDGIAQWKGHAQEVRQQLGLASSDIVIGKIANLSPVKNHETLIQAFAEFCKTHPDSVLVLIGQLRGRDGMLKQVAEQCGVQSRLVLTGPRTDAVRIAAAFDIYAMSSRSEGLPVSLLEAMALGKPVVCTAVGGIPGVVTDGENGFLVPAESPHDMAEKFTVLADDAQLRRRMGVAGRQRVRSEFDISMMVKRVERLYGELLGKKRSR